MKSLKELYRIGHGPSSSHTMGPYRAAEATIKEFPDAAHFEVTLYGSLAATGRGHFTDQAILNVLSPERTEIIWKPEVFLPQHPNGMTFCVLDSARKKIASRTWFSIGGGAISADGKAEVTPDCYPFKNMNEIVQYCEDNGCPIWYISEECEGKQIWDYLGEVLDCMMRCIDRGLQNDGPLPGELHLMRKARSMQIRTMALRQEYRRTGTVASYAYAVCEENASLGEVVTAPTCGSCGIIPALLRFAQDLEYDRKEQLHALACAGIIGNVAKQNGSISGAEVGCQGEVGVACAMAAGAGAYLCGGGIHQIEYAAEIGLEHFLGLTCDPLCGLVQVPCIERNALAVCRSMTAAEMSLLSEGRHIVSYDTVVKTMLETGHDLPSLYRETSMGGLAKFAVKKRPL